LLYYKASILFRGSKLEPAAELLYEYEALSGATPDLLALRADILRRMGKLEEAMADLNKCLEMSPNHFDAHYYLGTLHLTKDPPDTKAARECFTTHAKMVEQFKKAPQEWKCDEELFTSDKVAEGKRFVKLVERALKKDDPKAITKIVQSMNNVQYEDGKMKGAEDGKHE
jgi:tetratricopeptide (TPR) repeat protein